MSGDELRDLAAYALETYCDLKAARMNISPMVRCDFVDEQSSVVAIHGAEDIVGAVTAMRTDRAWLGLRALILLSDAYGREVVPVPGETQVFRHGDARRAFLAGDPTAYEVLEAVAVGDGSQVVGVTVRYVVEEGVPQFGEFEVRHEGAGAYIDALRAAWEVPPWA